jgi:hypothetical protein
MTSPPVLELLEQAVRESQRVAFRRRGTEYVVVAVDLDTTGRHDVLIARLPMTGEELAFPITELTEVALIT